MQGHSLIVSLCLAPTPTGLASWTHLSPFSLEELLLYKPCSLMHNPCLWHCKDRKPCMRQVSTSYFTQFNETLQSIQDISCNEHSGIVQNAKIQYIFSHIFLFSLFTCIWSIERSLSCRCSTFKFLYTSTMFCIVQAFCVITNLKILISKLREYLKHLNIVYWD